MYVRSTVEHVLRITDHGLRITDCLGRFAKYGLNRVHTIHTDYMYSKTPAAAGKLEHPAYCCTGLDLAHRVTWLTGLTGASTPGSPARRIHLRAAAQAPSAATIGCSMRSGAGRPHRLFNPLPAGPSPFRLSIPIPHESTTRPPICLSYLSNAHVASAEPPPMPPVLGKNFSPTPPRPLLSCPIFLSYPVHILH